PTGCPTNAPGELAEFRRRALAVVRRDRWAATAPHAQVPPVPPQTSGPPQRPRVPGRNEWDASGSRASADRWRRPARRAPRLQQGGPARRAAQQDARGRDESPERLEALAEAKPH